MPRASMLQRFFARAALLCLLALPLAACQLPMLGKQPSDLERAKNPCIVLALPASGPYSPIAAKIKRGAEAARLELARSGTQVRLENINTEAPDWLARLQALPPECALVGGPLRDKAYAAASSAGLLRQRAFFSFLPLLAPGDEGRNAWRFFPSPQDQVDALVNFATDQMNIRTYGAFYPSDNYGRRMTDIMEQALRKRHIPLQKAAYSPQAQATWKTAVQPLIMPKQSEKGPIPQTAFEALFLPDSWKNMDMVTSSLLANGEDRLVLLGTTLWEQGLAGKQVPQAARYELAVFPGAWNQAKAPAALKGAGNDFWSALGYDFINFGAQVGLAARVGAEQVNARARSAAGSVRGLAPFYWDENGVAHERLYLFQISPAGMAPLDLDRFRQRRTAVSERAALRMQGWENIDPATGEALPEAQQVALPPEEVGAPSQSYETPEPVQATPKTGAPEAKPAALPQGQPGVMSDRPRPSYKLSLPARR